MFYLGDIIFIALSLYLSFLIRFEGQIPKPIFGSLIVFFVIALAIKFPVFYLLKLYQMSWEHIGLSELISVFKAVSLSSILLGAIFFLLRTENIIWTLPRSTLIVDFFLTLFLIGAWRAAKRIYSGTFYKMSGNGRRVLIVGAGDAGEQIVRSILRERRFQYFPVGFVDDDKTKQGITIHGVRVLGTRQEIPTIVQKHEVEGLLITMPSAASPVIRETVELGRQSGLKQVQILPGFHELVTGRVEVSDIRDVKLEDLLGRDPVCIEAREIESYLKNKMVLVTGAAGSIGSEICRQVSKFSPQALLALDQEETGLFYIENELHQQFPNLLLHVCIADICDKSKIEQIFEKYHPQVVFHAAAYKHVPLMEANPDEAVKNNIFGTQTVSEIAQKYKTEKFVLISTDKAVNPTSVMGATKRVAEMLIQMLNYQGKTQFAAVRFGNVLGSRGSVIPIFHKQIKQGGPVTVTHKEMERFFMMTSEAVLLVLQAGAMEKGGEVFVLDMGKPVKIVDLAREMIRLSGYEPDKDIPIVFTGQRPGEKLFEEILTHEEGAFATKHEKIYMAKMGTPIPEETLKKYLELLSTLIEQNEQDEVVKLLHQIILASSRKTAYL